MKYIALCDFDDTLSNNNQVNNKSKNLISEYVKDNLLYVITYEKFDPLYKIFKEFKHNFGFISLTDNRWFINNEIIEKKINNALLNNIIKQFKDDIYTIYAENDDSTLIYNYKERLDLLYPKKNRKIINEFEFGVKKLTIAIANSSSSSLKEYLKSNNIYFDEYAKDKNREILIISAIPNTKEEIVKLLINEKKEYISVGIANDINDYKYLKHCNIKIAMLNSNEDLKKLCDYTTEFDNKNDGCMIELVRIYNSRHS